MLLLHQFPFVKTHLFAWLSSLLLISSIPVFGQKYIITVSVKEEQPIPFKVTNLLSDSSADRKWSLSSSSSSRRITYEIIQWDGLTPGMLRVDPNGDLMVVERLDRESVCTGSRAEHCEMNILVNLNTIQELLEVKMRIIDINDHAPRFSQASVDINISEDAKPGYKFSLPTARDEDSRNFSVRDYRISRDNPSGYFTMERVGTELFGVLRRRLDYEDRKSLSFVLECMDGGSPSRSGSTTIMVRVQDSNDHTPRFTQTSYEITLNEEHPLSMKFLQLAATDEDSGINAELTFFIRSTAPDYILETFRLNANGALMLRQHLDYESHPEYMIPVVVRDNAARPLSSSAQVRVIVKDKNDNKPVITYHSSPGSPGLSVVENAEVGLRVSFIFASDKDAGLGGELVCSVDSRDFRLEYAGKTGKRNVYRLSTRRQFNREVQRTVPLIIQCSDRGTPAQWSQLKINVNILDVNDNAPIFTRQVNIARVREDARPGTNFHRLLVHDVDAGKNAEIRYQLVGPGHEKFYVHGNGSVACRGALDRETIPRYNFTVIATDQGTPPRSATASLEVIVEDVNDVTPRLAPSSRVVRVREDAKVGSVVSQLHYIDEDSGLGGNVSFMSDIGASPYFSVSPNGLVHLRNLLDREIHAEEELELVLIDKGTPQLTGSETLRVVVLDVNDSPPVFHFPHPHNNTIVISYLDGAKGSLVTTVNVTDQDIGRNALLHYHLMETEGGRVSGLSLFVINATSGAIRTAQSLNHFHVNTYELWVEASDSGVPSKKTREMLRIIVDDSPSRRDAQEIAAANVTNFVIIIMLCAATIVLSSVLIVAIVHLRRRNRNLDREHALDEEADYLKVSIASSPVKGGTQNDYAPSCEMAHFTATASPHLRSTESDSGRGTSVEDLNRQLQMSANQPYHYTLGSRHFNSPPPSVDGRAGRRTLSTFHPSVLVSNEATCRQPWKLKV